MTAMVMTSAMLRPGILSAASTPAMLPMVAGIAIFKPARQSTCFFAANVRNAMTEPNNTVNRLVAFASSGDNPNMSSTGCMTVRNRNTGSVFTSTRRSRPSMATNAPACVASSVGVTGVAVRARSVTRGGPFR